MAARNLVVVGASAGGVEALQAFVAALPGELAAALLCVVHRSDSGTSALAQVLDRAGALPVAPARDGEPLVPGRIWVAPPGRHLLVDGRAMALRAGPREHRHRPAVDPLFRTAVRWYGPRVIAVVLSGALDDGALGAVAVHRRGGIVLAQSPDEARMPFMPRAVAAAVPGVRVAPVAELGRLVARLVDAPVGGYAASGSDVPCRRDDARLR